MSDNKCISCGSDQVVIILANDKASSCCMQCENSQPLKDSPVTLKRKSAKFHSKHVYDSLITAKCSQKSPRFLNGIAEYRPC